MADTEATVIVYTSGKTTWIPSSVDEVANAIATCEHYLVKFTLTDGKNVYVNVNNVEAIYAATSTQPKVKINAIGTLTATGIVESKSP